MQKYKCLVLPAALVLGYFFRQICAALSVTIPYVIFAILALTFSGVRLSSLRPTKLDLWIAVFQAAVSIAVFGLILGLTSDEVLAQGTMMCVLCPVASSVTVVATMLGANAERTTTYTIVGNLLVAVVALVYIAIICGSEGTPELGRSFLMILGKIAVVIALPFFVVWALQRWWPSFNACISAYKHLSFYLWAFALLITIGQTADFVALRWRENSGNVFWLGITSLAVCATQFAVGRLIGCRFGDRIAGGQLLAQKNSAMGIWMLNTFLNPIASVGMAYYSIWQNIFNSWQIYRTSK